jgi:hypothetical protein
MIVNPTNPSFGNMSAYKKSSPSTKGICTFKYKRKMENSAINNTIPHFKIFLCFSMPKSIT